MAQLEKTIEIGVPPEHFFKVLKDVGSYAQFLSDVLETKVLSQEGKTLNAEFTVKVVRRMTYVVEMSFDEPHKVSWVLKKGRLFTKNDGSWELKAINENMTSAKYSLDIEVNAFVPSAILKKLVSYSLPAMLDEWKLHAETTYGELS